MNLWLSQPPRHRHSRSIEIDRKTAFTLGLFLGLMLPLWIKILTK